MKPISFFNRRNFILPTVTLVAALVSGCATNYFPLKNETAVHDLGVAKKTVAVMPFTIDLAFYYSMVNTVEREKEKTKLAEGFIINALREELALKNMAVVDYLPAQRIIDREADEETIFANTDFFDEYNDAIYSIQQNLEKEKGKGFDYTVGLRVRDAAARFTGDPDLLLVFSVNGYVLNLAALEDTAMNTASAILTLGMSKVFPTTDDITSMEVSFVDADTGDILWIDSVYGYGRSILQEKDMRYMVQQVLKNLGKTEEK